jgi:hypothetical protein
MACTESTIHNPGPVAYEYNGQRFITHVQFDLLQDPDGNEGTQAVHEGPKSLLCQTCGDSDHVLLSHPCIEVLGWTLLKKSIEQRIAVVSGKEQYPTVLLGGIDE